MKMKTRISKVYEAYTALSDNRVEKIGSLSVEQVKTDENPRPI